MKGHRLRASQENGAILAEPPLDEVGTLLAENRGHFQQDLLFLGKPWQTLRQLACENALSAAKEYMRLAGEPLPAVSPSPLLPFSPSPPLILAGHQPELFHPGVWIKNFAIARVARQQGAAALNIIIDSDTAKWRSLFVPHGLVELDRNFGIEVPYEERLVVDEEFFAGFVARAHPLMESWPFEPMLAEFWPEVVRQRERTPLLGERIAAARRSLERRWGCHNLEVPLSHLCRTTSFAWFAGHLLSDLPRFHTIFNDALRVYRQTNRLRSRNHPVPDLARDGDWLEAPFWIWKPGQTHRDRLFVRVRANSLQIRQGLGGKRCLSRPDLDPQGWVENFQSMQGDDFKIRPRVLATTMYLRLLIGDTFLHGIGGAKYDELTDILIRRFYGIEPPGYLVLSGTLLLPLAWPPVSEGDVRRLSSELRDCWWNPERHLEAPSAQLRESVERKAALMQRPCLNQSQRLERFEQFRNINADLRLLAQKDLRRLGETLAISRKELTEKKILTRRDYPFCFYPEEQLRKFLTSVEA